jgi:L-asparaginase
LLKLGSLPVAADPSKPTPVEIAATKNAVAAYQGIFLTH